VRRLPVAAFVALAIATVAAFFITQHLKVSTPLWAGFPSPSPAAINPVDGGVCQVRSATGVKRVDHRSMRVSFYLLNRADDVDVFIVDPEGDVVRQIGDGVHMRIRVRHTFRWDGRQSNGSVAPDGTYYIRVALIHESRSALISNNTAAEPVTVETVPPRPRVTSVSPSLIPQPGHTGAAIRYTGNRGLSGRILIFRTDVSGPPRLVKSFASRRGSVSSWDGRLAGGRPAPQGTYLVGFKVTDRACNTGRFPAELPPVAGTTRGAGVTVRYLAVQPPLTPVAAGSSATVYVDARRHTYHWALRPAGTQKVLSSGTGSSYALSVRPPAGGPGLYELAIRWGPHRTVVPLVADSPSGHAAGAGGVLVILPALTWQGLNPVDDDSDGLPNTLSAGDTVKLGRPLVGGLPAGFAGEAALIAYLRSSHLNVALTTDLALDAGVGPALRSSRGVVLAGDERWISTSLARALRTYVAAGGHLLSLGIDSLRRQVSVADGVARAAGGASVADVLGARPEGVVAAHGALILAGRDGLHIFRGTSGAFGGFRSAEQFAATTASGPVASLAGASTRQPSVIGYRLGRGIVIDLGLPGFASSLRRSIDSRQLLASIWSVLSR
jgi:FlgD Ig-like domain